MDVFNNWKRNIQELELRNLSGSELLKYRRLIEFRAKVNKEAVRKWEVADRISKYIKENVSFIISRRSRD